MSGVQDFVNNNQYKLMVGLFLIGMFFARTEFMETAFKVFEIETQEEFKELKAVDEYNIGKTKRMIDNGDESTLLKTKIMNLELRLEICQNK